MYRWPITEQSFLRLLSKLLCFNLKYPLSNLLKQILYVIATFSGNFSPQHFVFLSYCYRVSALNFMLVFWQVRFVSNECHHKSAWIKTGILHHLIDPIVHWLKWRRTANIIAYYGTYCISVIQIHHATKLFMTACVPQMHCYSSILIGSNILRFENDVLLKVCTTYSDIMPVYKFSFNKRLCYWRFSDSRLTEQNYFAFSRGWSSCLDYPWSVLTSSLCFTRHVYLFFRLFLFFSLILRSISTTTTASLLFSFIRHYNY